MIRFTREQAKEALDRIPTLLRAFDNADKAKETVNVMREQLKDAVNLHNEHKQNVNSLGGKL